MKLYNALEWTAYNIANVTTRKKRNEQKEATKKRTNVVGFLW